MCVNHDIDGVIPVDENPIYRTIYAKPMKIKVTLLLLTIFCSCKVHQRSNIQSSEEFIVELKRPDTRGSFVETAIEGIFFGAKFIAEKTSKSLSNTYSQSISINDYYNTDLGDVEKSYQTIHIKKYAKPSATKKENIVSVVKKEFEDLPKSRGAAGSLSLSDVIREKEDNLLNFHAVIELISDPENPGITRLSFNELRVLFSKTKVFEDENLNARMSIAIEGQWRGEDGTPTSATLIEQEYDFKKIKYGTKNVIDKPILSPWYYDIPTATLIDDNENYGVIKVRVRLEEYEGNKSKYIDKLPSMLSDNKDAIISNGAAAIEKITN